MDAVADGGIALYPITNILLSAIVQVAVVDPSADGLPLGHGSERALENPSQHEGFATRRSHSKPSMLLHKVHGGGAGDIELARIISESRNDSFAAGCRPLSQAESA